MVRFAPDHFFRGAAIGRDSNAGSARDIADSFAGV